MQEFITKVLNRGRGFLYSAIFFKKFKRVGSNFKFYGSRYFCIDNCAVGDNCWFHAVRKYKGVNYFPIIEIGADCSFSNNVHISAVKGIYIRGGCLFGSNVYVGDHSHGTTKKGRVDLLTPPGNRILDDVCEITIGANVWVGDGVVILAGTSVGAGCIIGANSVVKGRFPPNSLVVGSPAKVIGEL